MYLNEFNVGDVVVNGDREVEIIHHCKSGNIKIRLIKNDGWWTDINMNYMDPGKIYIINSNSGSHSWRLKCQKFNPKISEMEKNIQNMESELSNMKKTVEEMKKEQKNIPEFKVGNIYRFVGVNNNFIHGIFYKDSPMFFVFLENDKRRSNEEISKYYINKTESFEYVFEDLGNASIGNAVIKFFENDYKGFKE